jgi:hypothetical protein
MDEVGELMALFEEASNTAEAIDALSEIGVQHDQIEVMTGVPYPEGALERHVEWSRLPYVVLAGALAGMLVGIFLSVITPHLYRLDIGGHPTVSFPPAAVIIFVFTMMATIISTFLGVLWEMGFPEFGPKKYNKMVTDGYLAIFVSYPPSLETSVRKLLEENGGTHIQQPEWQSL